MRAVLLGLLLVGLSNGLVSTRTFRKINLRPRCEILTSIQSTISNFEVSSTSKIQKWFILKEGKRAEVFVSDAASKASIIAEAWKSVLVSLRVLEADVTMPSYDCIYEFINVKAPDDMSEYETIAKSLEGSLLKSDPLFQQAFSRKIRFVPDPIASGDGSLLMILETSRTKSMMVSFEEIDYSPDVSGEDMEDFSNDLENFPFPTVMDFVSEINRPVDPFTMSELRFTFKPQDFKYDLVQMAKKKNPQKVVDGINCKLTRLQNWRDILSKDPGNMPDPFTEPAAWSAAVTTKFNRLKESAQSDPKGFLNTQYDKRTTFIKIIDLWSDRLKRAFKYIYQSQRPPEDFITPIMKSRWRNEVLNTTRLFAQIPFLDLQGPEFIPGSPAPLFNPERQPAWEEDYRVDLAMSEMLVWLQRIHKVNCFLGESPASSAPLVHHTYSRGYITERAMHDCWLGVEKWLAGSQSKSTEGLAVKKGQDSASLRADILLRTLKGDSTDDLSDDDDLVSSSAPADHTEDFLDVLRSLNDFTRAGSKAQAKSVKEMYRSWFKEGQELGDWWTTTVRNLDLVQEMSEKAEGRRVPWSEIISEMVEEELARDVGVGAEDKSGEDSDLIAEKWASYKPLMQSGELLESFLPWRGVEDRDISPEGLEEVAKMQAFSGETVHLAFSDSSSLVPGGFLFVCPRFFRGQGLSMEVSAFIEFASILSRDMAAYGSMLGLEAGQGIEVITLHPLMVTKAGQPDYARRAPHPALLFRIVTQNVV